jgi:hypothetical protein
MSTIDTAYAKFCVERFPLPTQAQVAAIEERIGVAFPDDYRAFLLNYNGGNFCEPDITPPVDECPLDGLRSLFGIGASHPYIELASESHLAIFTDNHPAQVVPIGDTSMGNLILLLTHPDGRGSIVLKKAFSQEYFLLARGIDEFFGLLREPTET